jgi:NAD(P)-dependent dehydrogenase (short-subunit alcohol dehydrogenase family)
MRLKDKVIIVTGAGSAIGRCMAMKMAEEGARVALVARTEKDLRETAAMAARAPGETLVAPADVTDEAATRAMAQAVLDRWGRIDALVNNAGSFYALGPVAEVNATKWWWDVKVNLLGTFLCSQAVLPAMISQKSGCIINLSGGGAGNPLPFGTGYASSKCALFRFTECLAHEVRDHNIRVFIMGPGFVRSRLTEYHVYSEEGKKYLPTMQGSFEAKRDAPPDLAARRAIHLIADAPMELTGRLLGDEEFSKDSVDMILEKKKGFMRVT